MIGVVVILTPKPAIVIDGSGSRLYRFAKFRFFMKALGGSSYAYTSLDLLPTPQTRLYKWILYRFFNHVIRITLWAESRLSHDTLYR